MSAAGDFLQPYRDLLDAGFPRWQIAEQVKKHVADLEALEPDVTGRAVAIAEAEEFLAVLVTEHGGQTPD